MSAYDDQETMFERVLEEAKALTSDTDQLARLETFLDNIHTRVKPCCVHLVDSKIGVSWIWDTGYVSVLFGDDQNWEWQGESAKCYGNNEDYLYFNTYSFGGGPSYMRDNYGPIYWLPSDVLKLIEVPDTFEGTYEPIIEKRNYTVVWVTSKYDGMLAGYCQYNGKLHLFEHVEETEFARHRMFAVFELSLLERMRVWWRYHVWYTILYNRVLWNMHTYKWQLGWKLKPEPEIGPHQADQREAGLVSVVRLV